MKKKQSTKVNPNDKNSSMKIYEENNIISNTGRLAKISFWKQDLKNNSFYCTEEIFNICGRKKTSDTLSLEDFIKDIHPDDALNYKQKRIHSLEKRNVIDLEYRIILPDLSLKWIHERRELITTNKTNQGTWQGTIQDVTEYKEKIEDVNKDDSLNHNIIKSLTKYIIRVDKKGLITYHNETFLEDFTDLFRSNSLLGKNALSILGKYQQNKIISVIKKCIIDPNTISKVEIKLSSSVTTIWSFAAIMSIDGELEEIQGFGIDISEQNNSKKSLIEIIERYNLACKATSDAIWDWDFKTNNLYWGEGFQTLFGHDSRVYSANKNVWESCIHPEDSLSTINAINTAIKSTENSWTAEYRFRKADGKYANVVDRSVIIRDANKKITRIVGAIQDITDKKKLEQLLEKVSILSKIGSFEVDFNFNKVTWSAMTRKIHEVEKDFTPNLNNIFSFYKSEANAEIIQDFFNNTHVKTEELDINIQISTAKGRLRWARILASKEFTDGKINKIIGSIQDIDKITKTEAEVLIANEEKNLILESIGDAFFAMDYNGIITYWNKQSENLLNLQRNETLGENIFNVFPEDMHASFFPNYQKCVQEKKSQHFEIYIDSMAKWFEVAAYPSLKGISVYFKDITKRKKTDSYLKKMNENLQKSAEQMAVTNKNFEQFSYIVSHNLRAPIANIMGLVELMGYDEYLPEIKEKFLKEIKSNINNLDNIISDLNHILQIKSNINIKKETVKLELLISSIHIGLPSLIQNKEVQIITEFNDAPEMRTVKAYLHSIFFNLISNSVKYSKPDITAIIKIFSEKSEDGIKIIYQDNGIGIDMTKKGDKIFGLYQRFHYHVEGKGMGLFMVKTQVEILGGQITVLSEVDKGTQFILEFKNEK